MAIKKAGFKAKLMTVTYVLQSNRAKFNQYSVDPTCLLCGEDTEDMIHFLLKCRSLSEPHDQFMEKISSILTEYQGTKEQKEIFKDFDLLAALMLDCTAINLKDSETRREDFLHKNSEYGHKLIQSPKDCAMHCIAGALVYSITCTTKSVRIINITKWWGAIKGLFTSVKFSRQWRNIPTTTTKVAGGGLTLINQYLHIRLLLIWYQFIYKGVIDLADGEKKMRILVF